MPCIDDNLLLAFARGQCSGRQRAEVDEHIDACDECRFVLAALLKRHRASDSSPASARGDGEPDLATKGETLVGRYMLERELGRGGMGAVWVARDDKLGRRVAVKMMVRELADDDRSRIRFEREAKAVAHLSSRHIVQLHDYGIDEGRPFMVMELLRGKLLSQRLRENRRLPLDVVARIVAQTAKALTTAHTAGIVHRDLKPENIFLVRDQHDDFVKVFDFGLAKVATAARGRALTQQGMLVGTPRYMSPEQLRAEPSDPRDDVWALSVIAYGALTGTYAFGGKALAEIVDGILTSTPPPPSHHRPSLGADVDALFARAFARDREQRFQSARDLASALAKLAGVSVSFGVSKPDNKAEPNEPQPPASQDAVTLRRARVSVSSDPGPAASSPPLVAVPSTTSVSTTASPRYTPALLTAVVATLLLGAVAGYWLLETSSSPEPRQTSAATPSDEPAPSTPVDSTRVADRSLPAAGTLAPSSSAPPSSAPSSSTGAQAPSAGATAPARRRRSVPAPKKKRANGDALFDDVF